MTYYAVIDTNVLISALLKENSVPAKIIEYIADGIIIPLVSDNIIREYVSVTGRAKFHFPPVNVRKMIDDIMARGEWIKEIRMTGELPSDEGDIVFYEVVMEKRKENEAYLVTGNLKHFPTRPFIVTPREMLEIIARDFQK